MVEEAVLHTLKEEVEPEVGLHTREVVVEMGLLTLEVVVVGQVEVHVLMVAKVVICA